VTQYAQGVLGLSECSIIQVGNIIEDGIVHAGERGLSRASGGLVQAHQQGCLAVLHAGSRMAHL